MNSNDEDSASMEMGVDTDKCIEEMAGDDAPISISQFDDSIAKSKNADNSIEVFDGDGDAPMPHSLVDAAASSNAKRFGLEPIISDANEAPIPPQYLEGAMDSNDSRKNVNSTRQSHRRAPSAPRTRQSHRRAPSAPRISQQSSSSSVRNGSNREQRTTDTIEILEATLVQEPPLYNAVQVEEQREQEIAQPPSENANQDQTWWRKHGLCVFVGLVFIIGVMAGIIGVMYANNDDSSSADPSEASSSNTLKPTGSPVIQQPQKSWKPTTSPTLYPSSLPSTTPFPTFPPTLPLPTSSPTYKPSTNGTLSVKWGCTHQLEVKSPEEFSDVQLSIYQLLMQSYTPNFGHFVGSPQIVTNCEVIKQNLGVAYDRRGLKHVLHRIMRKETRQSTKYFLLIDFTLEYESRFGYELEDYPHQFQAYVNDNQEQVTSDMKSRFLPVVNASAFLIPWSSPTPTWKPTTSPPTTISPTVGAPLASAEYGPPLQRPTVSPTTAPFTASPTVSPTTAPPTISPTITSAPSGTHPTCEVIESVTQNIMGSAPILRSSFGAIFSISTPTLSEAAEDVGMTESQLLASREVSNPDAEYVRIRSLSLRALSSLLSQASATNYQVWYIDGDYRDKSTIGSRQQQDEKFDARGDLSQWTLIAEGNSMGSDYVPEEEEGEETRRRRRKLQDSVNSSQEGNSALVSSNGTDLYYQEPLTLDSNYFSGAFPSDNAKYPSISSSLRGDGGMETSNKDGSSITTYLYQIPMSVFDAVEIPKYGGKASFYVTLDRAVMQFGDAEKDEWGTVDVSNDEYNARDVQDMNVRIHVGEVVTSFPWSSIVNFYTPRRFIGKVWYDQVRHIPCLLHETAPSSSPTDIVIPEFPLTDKNIVGEAIETQFVVSLFLQQDLKDAGTMTQDIQNVFKEVMVNFLNEEWVYEYCVWGVSMDVRFQKLSSLDGVRRLRGRAKKKNKHQMHHELIEELLVKQRNLWIEFTVLEVEMNIEGVAYDDRSVCPAGAIPATADTYGKNWKETMAAIGIDFVTENSEKLGERLQSSHPFFEPIFAMAADPEMLKRPASGTNLDDDEVEIKDHGDTL